MKKNEYIAPEMEIVEIQTESFIADSSGIDDKDENAGGGGTGTPGGWGDIEE